MKFTHILFVLLFPVLLASCTPAQQETEHTAIFIPLAGKKTLSVSDIFEEVRYIPLETNDSSLLRDLTGISFSKLMLKNGYIYTQYMSDPLFIFDENGKWIRTIDHRGQGPGEYLYFRSFDVNDNKEIVVLDNHRRKILFYSWEGKFLTGAACCGEHQTPATVNYLNDSLLMIHTPPGQLEGYRFNVLNRNTLDMVRSFRPTHLRQHHLSTANNIVEYQGKLIFYDPQNPYIYELTADSATLRYSIHIGGKIPPEDFWDIQDMTWAEAVEKNFSARHRQEYREKRYFGFITFFSEASETILLQFSGSYDIFDGTYAIVNKESGESILIDKIAFDSHFVWKPLKMYSSSKGIVIIPVPAHLLLESGEGEIRKMFPNLLEDDNPILCIAKLR